MWESLEYRCYGLCMLVEINESALANHNLEISVPLAQRI